MQPRKSKAYLCVYSEISFPRKIDCRKNRAAYEYNCSAVKYGLIKTNNVSDQEAEDLLIKEALAFDDALHVGVMYKEALDHYQNEVTRRIDKSSKSK